MTLISIYEDCSITYYKTIYGWNVADYEEYFSIMEPVVTLHKLLLF